MWTAVLISERSCRRGPLVYVSGQAEKAATPAEAAAKTIASLKQTLDWLGCKPEDAVQAKCFLTPMSAAADVAKEFDKAFGERKVPLVFVEWESEPADRDRVDRQGPAGEAGRPGGRVPDPAGHDSRRRSTPRWSGSTAAT